MRGSIRGSKNERVGRRWIVNGLWQAWLQEKADLGERLRRYGLDVDTRMGMAWSAGFCFMSFLWMDLPVLGAGLTLGFFRMVLCILEV